ncbi:hypothetical protein [Pseudomonas sp. NPDC086251]|uniref:hypothetical protein n=1 Tax=Pseudomonas sp. NPDC086251 TaxID=3364431 RepID=UPI0038340917
MVLPEQFVTVVTGHGAELIVDVGDPTRQVGLGKNRCGIHSPAVFLIHESKLAVTSGGTDEHLKLGSNARMLPQS